MGRVTASLDDDQHDWVRQVADDLDESQAEVMRQCISHARGSDAFDDAPESDAESDAPESDALLHHDGMMHKRITALAQALDADVVAELIREEVEDLEMPGRTDDDRDAQSDAVVAVALYLRDAESASPSEIRDAVYDAEPANYANATQWWENLNDVFGRVTSIKQASVRRWVWIGY
jgi:hypothetical protein